jgi:hypothetical protein
MIKLTLLLLATTQLIAASPEAWYSSGKNSVFILLNSDGSGIYFDNKKPSFEVIKWTGKELGNSHPMGAPIAPKGTQPNRLIEINTKKYRFDYSQQGDFLYEIDKTGTQRKFVKVENNI